MTTPGPPRSGQRSLGSCSPGCLRCEALGCVKCTGVIVHGSRECRAECPLGFQQQWSTVVDYMGLLCTGACFLMYFLFIIRLTVFSRSWSRMQLFNNICNACVYIYKSTSERCTLKICAIALLPAHCCVFLFLKSRASVRACSLKWGNYFKSKLQQCNSCSLSNFLY